jgi:hypothetical protein
MRFFLAFLAHVARAASAVPTTLPTVSTSVVAHTQRQHKTMKKQGPKGVLRSDFYWDENEEPHASRKIKVCVQSFYLHCVWLVHSALSDTQGPPRNQNPDGPMPLDKVSSCFGCFHSGS